MNDHRNISLVKERVKLRLSFARVAMRVIERVGSREIDAHYRRTVRLCFARLSARLRGHRVEAARLALSVGPVAALGEGQEPESAGCNARGGGGLGALTLLAPPTSLLITNADELTVLPRAIRAVRKSESLRGKNHSYREGDTH
jgi:hypothetical protein